MEPGLHPDLQYFCNECCEYPSVRGSWSDTSQSTYETDIGGSALYLLTTLFEVAAVVACWELAEQYEKEHDNGFSWSYTIHARRSGRIILRIVYHMDNGANV